MRGNKHKNDNDRLRVCPGVAVSSSFVTYLYKKNKHQVTHKLQERINKQTNRGSAVLNYRMSRFYLFINANFSKSCLLFYRRQRIVGRLVVWVAGRPCAVPIV